MNDDKQNDQSAEAVVDEDALQGSQEASPDEAAAEPVGQSLDEAIQENADLKDKLLRALAEVENMRQRATRDVDEARRYAVSNFARDLLDVADNLRRGLDSGPTSDDVPDNVRNLIAGVEMTERSLLAAFEKAKIQKVSPPVGDRFDHKLHQAMFEVPTGDMDPGLVAEVMQPGYVIAERLLRPALVGVSKKLPEPEPPANGDDPSAYARGGKVDTQA